MEIFFKRIESSNILYVLSLLGIAMVIDFFSGIIVAFIKNEVTSKIGIHGILRKIASMVLLVFFLPIAYLLPSHSGVLMLYVLYTGYLLLEIQSILENYQKLGIQIEFFVIVLEQLKELLKKK
jgi:toxin secretion/phage lysis holin